LNTTTQNILILGASYGSLLATKLALAGHNATMICLPAEQELINRVGTLIRLPVRQLDKSIEINSQDLPGTISACSADDASPEQFDLIVLAMQEPQYSVPTVSKLLKRVALSRVPCMSIMNMPPLPFLARIPTIDTDLIKGAYTDPGVWADFDPTLMTLASPDPQAFRPPGEPVNVLQVGLPTNFKVSRFDSDTHTQLLSGLQADIEAVSYEVDGKSVELPVKLKVHDSVFVPLAKWLMLITGNYRCVMDKDMRSINDAVHSDIDASRNLYNWVGELCVSLGAKSDDLVPFEKYAAAAQDLLKPSSAARALLAGAQNIERVDKVVQSLATSKGLNHPELDSIVSRVDSWLEKNRSVEPVS
jgi:ketopantoate reductase